MKATVRIQVTVDVPIADSWADGTDIAQVRRQAVDSGMTRLSHILDADPITSRSTAVRIIGEPRVMIVLVEDL